MRLRRVYRSMGSCLCCLGLTLVLNAACPGSGEGGGIADANTATGTITISGRVVDFQSCFSPQGCQGVEKVQVSLFYDTALASGLTKGNGVFQLDGVPAIAQVYLLVAGPESGYLTTAQARPLRTERQNINGLEIYALRATGSLNKAIEDELKTGVGAAGIYVGQVLSRTGGVFKAVSGARVTVGPAATVRYVKADRELDPAATEGFYPANRDSTGSFGQFVVISDGVRRDYAIIPTDSTASYEPVLAPLGKGFVSLGLHRGDP